MVNILKVDIRYMVDSSYRELLNEMQARLHLIPKKLYNLYMSIMKLSKPVRLVLNLK